MFASYLMLILVLTRCDGLVDITNTVEIDLDPNVPAPLHVIPLDRLKNEDDGQKYVHLQHSRFTACICQSRRYDLVDHRRKSNRIQSPRQLLRLW